MEREGGGGVVEGRVEVEDSHLLSQSWCSLSLLL